MGGEHTLLHAPAELTTTRLRRIGEGIGKVVYASEHWVVKRERSPREMLALILIWKAIRRITTFIPGQFGRKILQRPSRRLRLLRVCVRPLVDILPRGLWFMTHALDVWREYYKHSRRGERLSAQHLTGSGLVPEGISFPPTKVRVGGWPGWLTVDEATERVEATLHDRLSDLARRGDYGAIEAWLNKLLEVRQEGWRRGLFSTDAHLKNFGVTAERIVLLDPGGLTDRREVVERKLQKEETVRAPHKTLGLGHILSRRPEIARRFDERWKAVVNRDTVRRCWPKEC